MTFVWFAGFVLHSAVVGEVDEDADTEVDLTKVRAEPLKPVVH
jgi:hypothetical protein